MECINTLRARPRMEISLTGKRYLKMHSMLSLKLLVPSIELSMMRIHKRLSRKLRRKDQKSMSKLKIKLMRLLVMFKLIQNS
jgi:hypothetical protein